jgi:hypothetical protein
MKKIKIEQRIRNAVAAFYKMERENVEEGLSLVDESALLKVEAAARINQKGDLLVKILKRAFIFFPGVLYLFFGTFMIFAFDFLWTPLTTLAVFLIGSFLTIFGIGSLKKPKHLVIPLSVVAGAVTAFYTFSLLGSLKSVFEYGIYFFPLALIAPFLAKSLVEMTENVEL